MRVLARSVPGREVRVVIAALLAAALLAPLPAPAQCVGDCDGNNRVTIDDLIKGVNIALSALPVKECPAFANNMGEVNISQLILGVNNALNGCPPPVPTATATATVEATATATEEPTATATEESTATATGTPPGTPTTTETSTPPATETSTATMAPTETTTATPTITNAPEPTATATEVFIPPGESVAGRAAIVSTGLGGIQSIVGGIVAIVTNKGPSALVYGLDEAIGGPADTRSCPISGTTSKTCTEMGSGATHAIHLVLGADMCRAPGPAGGSAEFDGVNAITIDSVPGSFSNCSTPLFLDAMLNIDMLSVGLRNAMMQNLLTVEIPVMDGTVHVNPAFTSCPVSSLDLTLTGSLQSTLGDGTGVQVSFQGTQVTFDQITFNSNCVPVKYRLTFNGNADFTPMTAAGLPAGLASGDRFVVIFSNFRLTQDATMNPVAVTMSGSMSSDCFGGSVGLLSTVPVAVAAGQICPSAGIVDVTSARGNAQVLYLPDGSVQVTPQGGMPMNYMSCLDPELLMCLPQ